MKLKASSTMRKDCKLCGCAMQWENPHIPGVYQVSSCDIEDWTICHDCMVEHCCNTNCLGCEYGKYPDCRFLDMKRYYLREDVEEANVMEKPIHELVYKEYGLALMDCILTELAKIPEFKKLAMIRLAHDFLVKECNKETAILLSNDSNRQEYIRLKSTLDVLLPTKREQLIGILEIENILRLLGGE